MASNLTTVYLVKTLTGISGDNDVIARVISQVCGAIERKCDRAFGTTAYRAWIDGTGDSFVVLPEWPVTAVFRIGWKLATAASVYYNGGGHHATVSVDESEVMLHHVDDAGDETTTEITLALNKTIADVLTAIEAVVGWTIANRASEYDNYPSILLRPKRACGAVYSSTCDLDVLDDDDDKSLYPSDDDDRVLVTGDGRIVPAGHGNVLAWFQAGYTLPADNADHTALDTEGNVPEDLMMAATHAVKDFWKAAQADGGLVSEKIGDYGYTRRKVEEVVQQYGDLLRPYMRIEAL